MLFRAAALLIVTTLPILSASNRLTDGYTQTVGVGVEVGAAAPPDTINDFLPEDRSITDCISALPKPDCGSQSRGGWHQDLVLLALAGGLGFITWRIVTSARKAKRLQSADTGDHP